MIDMLSQINLITAAGGSIFGFIKAWQINKHQLDLLHQRALYKLQDLEFKDLSAARKDKSLSAKIGRFLLTGGVLFILLYIIVVTLAKDLPITIETVQPTGVLMRLFQGQSHHVYTTLRGAVIPAWMPQLLFMASGYWFGATRNL